MQVLAASPKRGELSRVTGRARTIRPSLPEVLPRISALARQRNSGLILLPDPFLGTGMDQQGQVLHRNILCFWSKVLHEMPLDLLAAAGLDSVWQCKT